MKKKWIKTIVVIVLVIGIGSGSYYAYNRNNNLSTMAAASTLRLTPVKVTKGDIDVSISASGTVTCGAQYDILTATSGQIDSVNFKEGDKIKSGDLIAKINDSTTEKNLQTSQIGLNQKNLDITKLQKSLNSTLIKSPATGRIKALNPKPLDDLSNLKTLGSAVTISRDGQMKLSVDVPAGSDINSIVYKNEAVNVLVNNETIQGTVTSTTVTKDTGTEKSIQNDEASLITKKNELDTLQKSLDNLYFKAPADGRIKALNLQPKDDLSNLKSAGSIMIINRDGKMDLTVDTDAVDDPNAIVLKDDIVDIYVNDNKIGEGNVITSTVKQVTGKISLSASAGRVEIEMNKDDIPVNAEVTVKKHNSSFVIGKSTVRLSDPVQISVTSGVVSDVYVSENSYVKKGDNLFKLDEDSVKKDMESKKQEIQQVQNELTNLKGNLAANQGGTAAASGTNKGTIVITIPRDDLPVNAKATVQKANSANTVIGTGTLQINDPVPMDISSGIVEEVYVAENSMVQRGDNLFKLSGDDIKVSIDTKNLDIQQTKLDLENYQETLDKTQITSPIDGIIAVLNINQGDNVTASKVAATVLDPDKMQVVVAVDELDIDKIKIGSYAKVNLDSVPGKTFDGEVTKIATLGKTTNGVTTYDVTVIVKNADTMKVGMTANVKIITQSKKNVLLLPATAIQKTKDSRVVINPNGLYYESNTEADKKNLKVVTDLSSALQNNSIKVQTGLANEQYVEITGGVKEGQTVLIPTKISAPQTQTTANKTSTQGGNFQGGGGFQGGGNFQGGR